MKRTPMILFALALIVAQSTHAQGPKFKIAAPTNVTVSSTIASLTITWTQVTGAASYVVNYRAAGSTIVTQLGQVLVPQFEMRPPVPGMAFEYQVVAVAKKNGSSDLRATAKCALLK